MSRASDGRSTLSRHLELLEAFTVDHPFLGVADVARRSGLALSTTHSLLADLERHGLVERRDDRTYRLGVRLWELASRTPGALGLREVALPHLQRVHEAVRQHVQLGILNGTDVLFLERLSFRHAVVSATIVGGRLPLHASATGLVLLADADEHTREAVLAGPLVALTEHTIHDADELRRALHRVRRQRYAITDGHIHPSARGIAVPVTGAAGETVAAVGAVVPNDDAPPGRIVDALHATADRITEDLRTAALPGRHPDASPGGPFRALVHSSDESMDYFVRGRGASALPPKTTPMT